MPKSTESGARQGSTKRRASIPKLALPRRTGASRPRKNGVAAASPVKTAIDYGFMAGLAGFWIRRANNRVLRSFDQHMSSLQFRPVEVATLLILESNSGLSQISLAAALITDQSTLVGLLMKLEQRGLIERHRSGPDRRFQVVNLSPKGRRALKEVKKHLDQHNSALLDALSPTERATLFALLKKFLGQS